MSFGHLAVEFWNQVENDLMANHGFSAAQAQTDIRGYRDRLASHGVTDMLYHWDPQHIASAVANGRFKLPPPGRDPGA